MDFFIEKIVARRKTMQDSLIISGLIFAGLILIFFVIPLIPLIKSMWLFFAAAAGYAVFYLVRSRNIEFEYIITNGDLDIDKITAQRKRKRIFSASCKEFDILAKLHGEKYDHNARNIPKRIEAVSSMDSPDVYFATAMYKGEKVVVFFEPDKRMLDAFKVFIPRKIFEY